MGRNKAKGEEEEKKEDNGEEVIFRDPICTPWAYGGGLLVPRLFPDPQGIWWEAAGVFGQ